MTGCKRIHYYIQLVHEKLTKVTIRIFRMARETILVVLEISHEMCLLCDYPARGACVTPQVVRAGNGPEDHRQRRNRSPADLLMQP